MGDDERGTEFRRRIGTVERPDDWQPTPPTSEDGDAMIAEEIAPWDYARTELRAVGFSSWAAFDRQRVDALAGYVTGIAGKVPGWTSPRF